MIVRNPIGEKGEDAAEEYLKKKGYKILERNFQGRQGEIDIIGVKDNILVFVEVKTRRSYQYGTPLESIRHAKISSILTTAGLYVSMHKKLPEQQRVDAIAITMDENDEVMKIEQIENISGF